MRLCGSKVRYLWNDDLPMRLPDTIPNAQLLAPLQDAQSFFLNTQQNFKISTYGETYTAGAARYPFAVCIF